MKKIIGRITGEQKVSEVLEHYPSCRPILARAGLDLCCGGTHPIQFATQAHGVALEPLLAELNAAIIGERKS